MRFTASGVPAIPLGGEVASAPRVMATQSSDGGRLITTSDDLDRYLREGESGNAAGVRVTSETAMRVAAVYGCVRIIAGKVGTLPLDLKRRVDARTREDADDHPLSRILKRRPNGWMKPAAFRRMLTAHILLRGNAYCRIVRGVRGDVQALLPLHPDRTEPKQQPDLSIRYEYMPENGVIRTFRQDEVLHLIGLTFDGIKGVSVLTYARESIGLAIATRNHGAAFFRNGTNVGSWIKYPNRLGPEGLEFLHSSIEKYRSEGDRAGGTLVLEEGAEFNNISMSAEDAQFVQTMGVSRAEIGMFFGVPPHMLGDTEKQTSWGSGIEQQSLGFVAYTLEDWLTCWEEACNADLLTDGEADLYVRFNRNALVRGDIKTRWEAYSKGRRMKVLSANDVRGFEDMNPIDGGDVYENPDITTTADGADATAMQDEIDRLQEQTGSGQ